MLEVVINSLLLHQSADEVEITLPVLHAIFPGLIIPAERLFVVGKALVFEHLLYYIGDLFLLKNAAVCGEAQEPQPWMHGRMIGKKVSDCPGLTKAAHMPAKVPLFALAQVQPDGDLLAEEVIELDVWVLAQKVDLKLKKPSQRLGGAHAAEQQYILAQRCSYRNCSMLLSPLHGLPSVMKSHTRILHLQHLHVRG